MMKSEGKEKGPKLPRTVRIETFLASVIIVAMSAFVLGGRAEANGWLTTSRAASGDLNYASVEQTYDALRGKFDGSLDSNKLLEGAARGLVNAAGDPYTEYFTDAEAKEFFDDLEGQFSGIGAELNKRDDKLYIVTTLDDSPARKAGLQANDHILKVNDQSTLDWSVEKAVSEIRGEKGTTVKLTIVRGDSEVKDFSIVRDNITNPSVKHEITDKNIGILRISRFAENDTVTLSKQAAEEFKSRGVKGVVLDLRGNGGGYLEAAQDIASIWLDDKVVVTERKGDKVIDTLKSDRNPILNGVPTVVLVDGGSASASEIVAGALSDNKAATLVGEKTFGKGSVQQFIDLPGDNGQLKVTVAKWFTPNGRNINKEGIKPDHEVKIPTSNIQPDVDPQKDKALELLGAR